MNKKKAPNGALVLCVGDTLDNDRRLVLVACGLPFYTLGN